jgi:hypothetical protein
MKRPPVSERFREMLRHVRGNSAVSKDAFKNACEYVAELEDFKIKIMKAVKE